MNNLNLYEEIMTVAAARIERGLIKKVGDEMKRNWGRRWIHGNGFLYWRVMPTRNIWPCGSAGKLSMSGWK
jgi:hypothetical protein